MRSVIQSVEIRYFFSGYDPISLSYDEICDILSLPRIEGSGGPINRKRGNPYEKAMFDIGGYAAVCSGFVRMRA